MAQTKTPAKRSFYEVVFRGKPKVVRAFLSGLMMGAGQKGNVYYSYVDGVHHEGKAEKLAEMVGIRGIDCHVIVEAATSSYLKKLARRIVGETGLEITANRKIRSASLDFRYRAYARRYDEEILEFLKKLPSGVKLRGFEHDVREDPSARGVEAYSPAHHFEAAGKGTLAGPVDRIIELKRRCADYPLIDADDVLLKTS